MVKNYNAGFLFKKEKNKQTKNRNQTTSFWRQTILSLSFWIFRHNVCSSLWEILFLRSFLRSLCDQGSSSVSWSIVFKCLDLLVFILIYTFVSSILRMSMLFTFSGLVVNNTSSQHHIIAPYIKATYVRKNRSSK